MLIMIAQTCPVWPKGFSDFTSYSAFQFALPYELNLLRDKRQSEIKYFFMCCQSKKLILMSKASIFSNWKFTWNTPFYFVLLTQMGFQQTKFYFKTKHLSPPTYYSILFNVILYKHFHYPHWNFLVRNQIELLSCFVECP